jgi:hypothetical protein
MFSSQSAYVTISLKFLNALLVMGFLLATLLAFTPSTLALSLPSASDYPTAKMIVATATTNDGQNISGYGLSNNGQWADVVCLPGDAVFTGSMQSVLGVADYNDGINLRIDKEIANGEILGGNDIRDQYPARNCETYNIKAGNQPGVCDTPGILGDVNPRSADELFYALPGCPAPQDGPGFQYTNNPLYIFQFNVDFTFPDDRKQELSETYRDMTQLDGIYDGVTFTYTYYTHRDFQYVQCVTTPCPPQIGDFLPWENPNQGNEYGGWLVHGYEGEGPSLDSELFSTRLTSDQSPNIIDLRYDPETKILFVDGTYVGNDGCTYADLRFDPSGLSGGVFVFEYERRGDFCTQATVERTIQQEIPLDLSEEVLSNFENAFRIVTTR